MRSSLVVFEQQHLVGEEEQEEGEEGHGHQDGDHPREGHGDEEGGHEVGVSLSNGVGLITMELNVLLFGIAGGGSGAAPRIPALLEALEDAGQAGFDD